MENMDSNMIVFKRLQEGSKEFPTQQKQVCEFLLNNYREAAFLTIKAIAEKTGVGPATVMRTMRNLGYASFMDFQKKLHNIMTSTHSLVSRRLEQSLSLQNDKRNLLERVVEENRKAIIQCLSTLNIDAFNNGVERLCEARQIQILGMRYSQAASESFFTMCRQVLPNVRLPACCGSENMYEQLIDLQTKDILLAISAGGPHYSSRTIQAVKYAINRGIPVILITDDPANWAVSPTDQVICVSSTSGHYSLVPVMTALDALLVEVCKRKKSKVLKRLHYIEKLLIHRGINN